MQLIEYIPLIGRSEILMMINWYRQRENGASVGVQLSEQCTLYSIQFKVKVKVVPECIEMHQKGVYDFLSMTWHTTITLSIARIILLSPLSHYSVLPKQKVRMK